MVLFLLPLAGIAAGVTAVTAAAIAGAEAIRDKIDRPDSPESPSSSNPNPIIRPGFPSELAGVLNSAPQDSAARSAHANVQVAIKALTDLNIDGPVKDSMLSFLTEADGALNETIAGQPWPAVIDKAQAANGHLSNFITHITDPAIVSACDAKANDGAEATAACKNALTSWRDYLASMTMT